MRRRNATPLLSVLISRSQVTQNKCWEWQGAKHPYGYGAIGRNAKVMLVHRLSWELYNGPIPNGLFVLHTCDNPPCWNPAHLFLGTHQDNSDDKVRKGRQGYSTDNAGVMRAGEDHKMAKLTWEDVRQIRKRWANGERQAYLAKEFKMSNGQICEIVHNRAWKEGDML